MDFLTLPPQQQLDASGEIHKILKDFAMLPHTRLPDGVLDRRLNSLCFTQAAPSKAVRLYRILQTKIENRVRNLFSRRE